MTHMKGIPRNRLSRLILAVLLASLSAPVFLRAQASGASSDLADRVSAALAKFPSFSGTERDAAAAAFLALGEPGFLEACRRLVPSGTDDDSLVRYALHGAAVYVTRAGAESERAAFIAALLKALEAHKNAEAKVFLISQIQWVAKDEAVPAMAACLADPDLADPAARTLVTIGGAQAEKALLTALTKMPGAAPLPVIQALGSLRSRSAVPELLALTKSADPQMREAVLNALAEIGDPSARSVLEMIPLTLSGVDRTRAAERFLRFGERLIANGDRAGAQGIFRALLTNYTAPAENHIRSAALDLLGRELGEAVLLDLLKAVDSSDRMFRQKALAMAETLPAAGVSPWIAKAASLPPANLADVIAMLGRRGDKDAEALIRDALKSGEPAVRSAAIAAYARLKGVAAADELAPFFNSDDPEEVQAVKEAAEGWPTDLVAAKLTALFPGLPPAAKKAAVEIFGDRQAGAAVPLLLDSADAKDEGLRSAALDALESAARPEDLPAVLERLSKATSNRDIVALQNAAAAASNRIIETDQRANAILAALKKAKKTKRADFLRPLARIGGAKALKAVVAELQHKEPVVRAAAAYALSNWPDASALGGLFALGRGAADLKTRYLALQGIVRLLGEPSAPAGRIARWREAFDLAAQPVEKNLVIAGLGNIRDIEAAKLASGLLAKPEYQAKAAAAIIRMALPAPGIEGLTGFEAALALRGALPYVESAYDREQAQLYARELLLKEGFEQTFNGKDLSGWKGLVADPPARAKMTSEELLKAQAEADELMRKHWRVVDETLVFDGAGHSLCTKKDFGDFEMFVDWKIESKGDSGIYLRGSPQVQIWDPAQWPVGSGGLYNNQKNPKDPLVTADRPIGEWNTFYIRMTGDKVTVLLNGVPVVDNVVLENYWERDKPIYPVGQIELQAHSTTLYFKNIFIRPLPGGENASAPAPSASPADGPEEGFAPLFNGRDLTGWRGDIKGYVVENGVIAALPEGTGNLYTEKEYSDFNLRFEFKLTPGANNGIGIRAPLTGDAAYVGMEIQVLDDSADQYKSLNPYQYHGSIYGVVPCQRGFQKPVGEWNAEEIIARGRRITVILNGTVIVDADIDAASASGTVDHREHPGLKNPAGHIGFLGHGSHVEFRNLRIKELR
jgi:HEAT repeat protein